MFLQLSLPGAYGPDNIRLMAAAYEQSLQAVTSDLVASTPPRELRHLVAKAIIAAAATGNFDLGHLRSAGLRAAIRPVG